MGFGTVSQQLSTFPQTPLKGFSHFFKLLKKTQFADISDRPQDICFGRFKLSYPY